MAQPKNRLVRPLSTHKREIFSRLFVTILLICASTIASHSAYGRDNTCSAWLDHTLPALHSSKTFDLCDVSQNKTLLIVNTASFCGFTFQFGELEKLYQKYREKGFVIVGFPSNSFNQEAKTAEKTASVCYKNYGVSFPMTNAVAVKGPDGHPVFKHLAKTAAAPSWNFNKYLVGPDGKVIQHYGSQVSPLSDVLTSDIEKLISQR